MTGVPSILPDQATGVVEIREDGSMELVLPWARSATYDEATMRVSVDPAVPVEIHDEGVSLPRRAPTAPIDDQTTRRLEKLSIREKLAVMKALVAVLRAAGVGVDVTAMPWRDPEKVHLQASDWRTFRNQLAYQASIRFVHVNAELVRMLRSTREARRAIAKRAVEELPDPAETGALAKWDDVVENLKFLSESIPNMENRKAGEVLHIPLVGD